MVYRDDDLAQLRSEVNAQKERLDNFEALYNKEGIKLKKSLISKFFSGLWTVISAPFVFVWFIVTEYWWPMLVTSFIIGVVGGIGYLIYNDSVDRNLRIANEANSLLVQCTSFCATHGYHFYPELRGTSNRQDTLCFCGTEDLNETAFIIDVESSENWTVAERTEE